MDRKKLLAYLTGSLVATDFFTADVWTGSGLITYYVLFLGYLAVLDMNYRGGRPPKLSDADSEP